MKKQKENKQGYIQIGNEEECFGQTEHIIVFVKEAFSPKCNELTSKLTQVIKEFKEIGVEIDLSVRYNQKKVRELIEVKTN